MAVADAQTPLPELLAEASINLDASAAGRDDAIRQAGQALLDVGAIDPAYIDAMIDRENTVSTFMGEGVAIPHGTDASRALVRRTTLGVLQFPDGVDWDGQRVTICVAIAAKGDEHVSVLSALARILMDPAQAERLRSSEDPGEVHALLATIGKGIDG